MDDFIMLCIIQLMKKKKKKKKIEDRLMMGMKSTLVEDMIFEKRLFCWWTAQYTFQPESILSQVGELHNLIG